MTRDVAPDPPLPLAALARPAGAAGGAADWLAARLPGASVAVSANARAAIRQAADRLGVRPGDEVLLPAWNCGSETDPWLHAGASVRLTPVDGAGRLDPDDVAARIGPRTRAVHLTHYFGRVQPETAALAALCKARGIALLEDCALALLSDGPDGPVGRHGDAAAFCFYKFLPLVGGGALALREGLAPPRFARPYPPAREARALAREAARRLLGRGALAALRGRAAGEEDDGTPGGGETAAPGRPPPLEDIPGHYYFDPAWRDAGPSRTTARLLARLDLAGHAAARHANHARLAAALAGRPDVTQPLPPPRPGEPPLAAFALLPQDKRDRIVAALQARGIAASPWWSGFHRGLDWSDPAAKTALTLKRGGIALPVHPALDEDRMDAIAEALGQALRAA